MTSQPDPLTFFRLKPIRAARVSEISETTAARRFRSRSASISTSATRCRIRDSRRPFLRIALGIDVHQEDLRDAEPDAILEYLGWETADKPKLEFLIRTIQKSSPYMPRGGYSRKTPHALVKAFCSWLEHQQEPLRYDTGEQSGGGRSSSPRAGFSETLRDHAVCPIVVPGDHACAHPVLPLRTAAAVENHPQSAF